MLSQRSVKLFRRAARNVPAYRTFIRQHGINPRSVRRPADLALIPTTNKANYLRSYPLSELLWGGDFARPLVLCSTSGSTGEPFYFPRTDGLSQQYADLISQFLDQASVKRSPTLVIIGFGMGVWIGGVITHRAFEIAAQKRNLSLSILPAGYNKPEIIKALRQLSPQYAETVLAGYPPFLKDVVDAAEADGINLKKLNLRFLTAAESFTEAFRDYMVRKAGIKDVLRDTLNIYGTADIGAMAHETPVSILIRRLLARRPRQFEAVFQSGGKTPTLAQYNPEFIEFESVDGDLLLTGDSALPLLRYQLGDHGGVYQFDDLVRLLELHGINLDREASRVGIHKTIKKWPFVYVYERADMAASLHGIIIYPEFIKEALLAPEVAEQLTEKFTMITKTNRLQTQFLEINIELRPGVKSQALLKSRVHKLIVESLKLKSSEFREISKDRRLSQLIKIVFWPFEHSQYFAPGVKQKWTRH